MIKIQINKGKYAPVLVCDVCGGRIKDAVMATTVFTDRKADGTFMKQGELTDLVHVHKGQCFLIADRDLGGLDGALSEELRFHLLYLLHNSGMNQKKLSETEKMFQDFGGFE